MDNFLPDSLIDLIEQYSKSNLKWSYNPNIANGDPNTFYPGFGEDIFINNNNHQVINVDNLFFYLQILYYFCNNKNILIDQIYRTKLNLYLPSNYNLSKYSHVDLVKPHLVLLYYVNNSDGDTILFEEDGITEIKRISPKKGKAVLFNGNIKHAGSYPTKNERIMINFNFKTI